MIRMIQCQSAGRAKTYFSDALSKSDYYLDDQELAGVIRGRLADRLGLNGEITKEVFFSLCENRDPVLGNPLTPRTKEDRRIGYDINFHAPKSVSILHFLSGDDHIQKAFQECVHKTMLQIEADSQTRVRKDGKTHDRKTGELLWVDFLHQTARPVDGSAPDPHLHSHQFVFNCTYDSAENRIKAGQFGTIKQDMPYYQALFHKLFSDRLIDLGYQVRRTDKSFEVVGVPKNVIDLFSKRSNEIGQFAKERGIHDAKALDALGARTRSKKQKGLGMTELKTIWKTQIRDLGESGNAGAIRFDKEMIRSEINPQKCVDYTLSHSFERASVVPERRLLETVFRQGIGDNRISSDALAGIVARDERIIKIEEKGRIMCTTRDVLREEKEMIDLAKAGRGAMRPIYEDTPVIKLQGQQASALMHVLTTSNRVSIIRGVAGAGKTTLLNEAKLLINEAGKEVYTFAPSTEASKGVLVNEGFKNADTVARLLVDKTMQQKLANQVLVIDEAGMLGTRDTLNLLKVAKKQNAHIVFVGDTRQHASVVRGDALRILNTVGGIRSAEVNKIYRQKTQHYKAAVEDLSQGKVKSAFDRLSDMGAIQEIDPLNPNSELVKDYVSLLKKGKFALIVSPTHKQGDDVTELVRTQLKDVGMIGKKEINAVKLNNLNLTEAEKSDVRNFKDGQVVQFNQNYRGIKRGSLWTVNNIDGGKIYIVNSKGDNQVLPQDKSSRFDLYEMSALQLAKGDKIKITRNGFDAGKKRLNNGQTLEVSKVGRDGKIFLKNKQSKAMYEINRDFGHITHAHCITSHAAQGKTVDHVLIAQPSSTFAATDAKQFYVSVSRARESVRIYTDDKDALLEYASQMGDRQSALELTGRNNDHEKYIEHLDRTKQHEKNIEKQKDYSPNKTLIDRDYDPS